MSGERNIANIYQYAAMGLYQCLCRLRVFDKQMMFSKIIFQSQTSTSFNTMQYFSEQRKRVNKPVPKHKYTISLRSTKLTVAVGGTPHLNFPIL
jgi:hypothetical protein